MNRKEYNSDSRYAKVLEQMDLLGIMDITTTRQNKNGTIIWKLPIKKYGQFIEVGSFKSGYARRMNGGYTPYQLNKTENHDHYYKDYKWERGMQVPTGKYNKHVCRRRILIPNEVDRLEYLIAFCLKNYYINQANMIEEGKFIPKWKHEYEMQNGSMDKVRELQKDIQDLKYESIMKKRELQEYKDRYEEISLRFKETAMELSELHVSVNGHKYKVI